MDILVKRERILSKIKEFKLTIEALQILREDASMEDYARGQQEVYERMVSLLEGLL